MNLAHLLDVARAEVDRLERLAKTALCAELGEHDWTSIGGCNAGCHDACRCSVPVNVCQRCGACDYGDNKEAADIMAACKKDREDELLPLVE